ncbi:uncharacterized protein LOC119657425 [Hermetia illucens]|uniref:uncharacterized protein LOC119657425 n=1 Tax=Hermetia illucens TaxID=343691 RepID=UPI0018CC0F99|nr:uncharacterized protein LOC119657425 [Hermetia illucens]
MEITLNSTLPARMVSTTPLNGCNEDHQVACVPTILLHDSSKKGNKKSEETVHIPTKMVLANAVVSDSEQQQHYQPQQQQPVIFTTSGGKSCSSRIHVNRTECTSAVTESVSSSEKDFHVVKIQISPNFKNTSSNSNSSNASSIGINNNTIEIQSLNISNASGDHQDFSEITEQKDKLENTQVLSNDERSSTVVIGGDLYTNPASVKDSNSFEKSDLTSDLSIVQQPLKSPKVSIVSFISDDQQNKYLNEDRVDEDQCKLSVKSVSHKRNISQTFLNKSNDEISLLKQDPELSPKSTTLLTLPSNPLAVDQDIRENLTGITTKISSEKEDSPVLSTSFSDLSVLEEDIKQDKKEATLLTSSRSTEQSPSAVAPEEEETSIEVLNTHVIVDTSGIQTATITSNEMVQKPSGDLEVSNPTYLYYMMTSGQCSPSDTLDSGTCSDMENGGSNSNSTSESVTPPPLPKKMGPKLKMLHLKTGSIISEDHSSDEQGDQADQKSNGHTRTGSFTDSEESECSLSCDSLNSSEFARSISIPSPPHPPMIPTQDAIVAAISLLPDCLLRDIRDRKFTSKLETTPEILSDDFSKGLKIDEDQIRERNTTCVLITQDTTDNIAAPTCKFETDKFYKFHINEMDVTDDLVENKPKIFKDDETFAGYKDIHSGTSTIRSSKGTVRGVKNRVRNGIATFLQMQQTNVKNYKEKDSGKVVLYTTSMGIIRETYAKCANVKQILRTLLIKFEERDVFMSCEYQQEIKDRMQTDEIQVPQLFVEGQHIGDAATVERLNESGELRQMLKPYKSMSSSYTCQFCGGYRLLPCPSCNGSKKSVHRNHFTTEFVALKCMNCDEVGLVKCHNC